MDDKPLIPGNKYYLQHQSKGVRAVIRDVAYKLDVNTLMQEVPQGPVTLNEVVKATIKTASPLSFDQFAKLRQNGSAILVDETSNSTVAAVLFQ
jgi:sulfate adenylyltransferase subunit 1